jgi:hypothetical protein
MNVDEQTSQRIAHAIRAVHNDCWANAYRGLSLIPGAVYVRLQPDFYAPIDHGWIESSDSIIDPTPMEIPPERYFPALRFSLEDIHKAFVERPGLPLYESHLWEADQWKVLTALEQAIAYCKERLSLKLPQEP